MITANNYDFSLTLPADFTPRTVRKLMQDLLLSKTQQHDLRIRQNILVNGTYKSMNELVNPSDFILFKFENIVTDQLYQPSNHMPEVIFEDQNLLVINKLAGQKTHPTKPGEFNTAINDAANYLNQFNLMPAIVHRLDQQTSGLLLFAKNPVVVPMLNRQLKDKTMKRIYLAWVENPMPINESGTIDLPIAHAKDDARKRMIDDAGKHAITHYHVLKTTDERALVELSLETGRTHQIRVHLAAIGHPIIGDELYQQNFSGQNLQLQAVKLKLIKPFSFDQLDISLPASKILA